MLAIEVELLGGRYVATAHDDRSRAEWPPHPARFFSALVAALHEREPADAQEREALLWLERQPPPGLELDPHDLDVNRVGRRAVKDVFVPVNDITLAGDPGADARKAEAALRGLDNEPPGKERDQAMKKAAKALDTAQKKLARELAKQQVIDASPSKADLEKATALLPERRTRQMRTFPVVIPARTTFTFIWPEPPPPNLAKPLAQLCARVTRLGHSSSLVRCHIVDHSVAPNLVPNDEGELVLRTVGPGQLQRLEVEFERHQGVEGRVLPMRPHRYGPPQPAATELPRSTFSDRDWIVFERVDGAKLMASRAADLARALRAALLQQHGLALLPPILSGHETDGSRSRDAHLAFVPLPFVGHAHADGRIMGIAIVPPRCLREPEHAQAREQLLRLVAGWVKSTRDAAGNVCLFGNDLPPMKLKHADVPTQVSTLPSTWTRASRRFATATPILLDRFPGNLRSNQAHTAHKAAIEAQQCVVQACKDIGLPQPDSVTVSFSPLLRGASPTKVFRPAHGPPRVRVHAELVFGQEVRGPVLLGAGRYFGLGLCRPIREDP